jgi:hypothetical protein
MNYSLCLRSLHNTTTRRQQRDTEHRSLADRNHRLITTGKCRAEEIKPHKCAAYLPAFDTNMQHTSCSLAERILSPNADYNLDYHPSIQHFVWTGSGTHPAYKSNVWGDRSSSRNKPAGV